MISIIISAYNEEKVITNRIENIRASTYPIEKYEVIFVDDCSTDNTLQSAESAFKHAGISY
ncbi:glycosyltransferase, partial [Methanocalculus sp. MSAO_Arc2]|uniref:glycosyltransferase n=1 Tax=Methanocalculus sp. MSAO_Arc2 TaxID=2293855 RepID=UPI003216BDFA